MARRRSRSPLKVRLSLPLRNFTKKSGFPTGHFYNFKGDYSTSTVKIGESLNSLFTAPLDVCEHEWLAYHLHFLIERTSNVFDFMQFHCRDGVTLIDYDSPVDYAVPVDMSRFSEGVKQRYHHPYALCENVVRVGAFSVLPIDQMKMTLEENDDAPLPYNSLITITANQLFEPVPGATTYIKTILTYLKELRMNTYFFPRKKTEEIRPRAFRQCAGFILHHLINIMSHFVSCHVDQIEKCGVANQVFSLFLSVFIVAERHQLLPPRKSIDDEVFEFYRHLKTIDETIYDDVPDIQDIYKISKAAEEASNQEASGTLQPSTSRNH